MTTQERPLVSIITCVYNGVDTLHRTLESVRSQDYPHLEYIVVDGGSTDGSLDMIRANEDILTWTSERDRGLSDGLNKGLARATGQYLTWLNADDFLRPGAISRCLQVHAEHPGTALVYGHIDRVNRDGSFMARDHPVYDGTRADLLRGDNFVGQPDSLFTREAWQRCGPFRIDLSYCMDWDLWLKMTTHYPIRFSDQVFACQAIYAETLSASGGLKRFEEIRDMIEGHGGGAAHTYFKIGHLHYQQRNMREARRNLWIALRRSPRADIRRYTLTLLLKSYLGGGLLDSARALRDRVRRSQP